jgi:ribonuclease-3
MLKSQEALQALQQRLGYQFKRVEWLTLALTHSADQGQNNQRLEFLGDAILGVVVSKHLFEVHPDWNEGDLSVGRTALVCKDHLASVARSLNLSSVLIIRKEVAKSGPVHAMPAVLADALEALMGAIFLDGGYQAAFEVACSVIVQHEREGISNDFAQGESFHPGKDPKTRLQEWLQAKGLALPIYSLVKTEGPPNDCVFYVECLLSKPTLSAHGEGRNRKTAEQGVAAHVLQQLLRESDR